MPPQPPYKPKKKASPKEKGAAAIKAATYQVPKNLTKNTAATRKAGKSKKAATDAKVFSKAATDAMISQAESRAAAKKKAATKTTKFNPSGTSSGDWATGSSWVDKNMGGISQVSRSLKKRTK